MPSVGELFLDYETRMKAYNIHWEIFSATNSIISQEKKKLLTETRLDGNISQILIKVLTSAKRRVKVKLNGPVAGNTRCVVKQKGKRLDRTLLQK